MFEFFKDMWFSSKKEEEGIKFDATWIANRLKEVNAYLASSELKEWYGIDPDEVFEDNSFTDKEKKIIMDSVLLFEKAMLHSYITMNEILTMNTTFQEQVEAQDGSGVHIFAKNFTRMGEALAKRHNDLQTLRYFAHEIEPRKKKSLDRQVNTVATIIQRMEKTAAGINRIIEESDL